MSRFTGTSEQHRLRALLRQIRVEAGLKQTDMAARLEQSQSFVSKYESGERRLDLLELRAICAAVGLSLRQFVHRFERTQVNETRPKIPEPAKTFLGERPKH
jgi:transcriptional regulator with XRE-family HTH domain